MAAGLTSSFLARLIADSTRSGVQPASSQPITSITLLTTREPVGLVVDRKVGVDSDQRRVLPQHPRAEAMKRADPDPRLWRQGIDALAHLAGGLVGEGQRQNLVSRNSEREQASDSSGDDARLAGAGAGQDQKRTVV